MRRAAIALVAAALLSGHAAFAEEPAALITHPEWTRRPDGGDLARVYPRKALTHGTAGYTKIKCGIDAAGKLRDCTVLVEAPADLGFGAAAIALSSNFQMSAQTSDGRSVEGGTIIIPISFCMGSDCKLTGPVAISRVVWSDVPTRAEVAEALAAQSTSDSTARATLSCAFNPDGTLRDCRADEANRAPKGLLEAALRLTPHFKMATETLGTEDIGRSGLSCRSPRQALRRPVLLQS